MYSRPNASEVTDRDERSYLSLRRKELSNSYQICGKFTLDVILRNYKFKVPVGLKNLHTSSSACCSAGAVHDVPSDLNNGQDQTNNSTILSNPGPLGERTLKLLSGSCYLPHPAKEETGGEDAHFISADKQVIGVADGVGGWADVSVDAGKFSRELMSNSLNAIQEEPCGSVNPARVLEMAHSNTKAKGSSTACIIALTEEGTVDSWWLEMGV